MEALVHQPFLKPRLSRNEPLLDFRACYLQMGLFTHYTNYWEERSGNLCFSLFLTSCLLCLQAQANCRVGIAALNTLAGYIDWVALSHITADNCKLLEMLCLLLNEPELQIGAAECLLIAVSRKVSSSSATLSPLCFPSILLCNSSDRTVISLLFYLRQQHSNVTALC